MSQITAPTLIIEGTVDTLFTLGEGIRNYNILTKNGVAVSMIWYCEGHGVCLTNPGDPERVRSAVIAWLDRYVAEDGSGPVIIPEGKGSVLAGLVESITPSIAQNAVNPPLLVQGGPHLLVGQPESTLTLQIVATTVAYSEPQFGGQIVFDSIELSLLVMAAGQMTQTPG